MDNKLAIKMYLHCALCLEELPPDTSPQEWTSLEVGWTEPGLQIWCKRHNCNVVHIDFEGHQHPVDDTRHVPQKLKVVATASPYDLSGKKEFPGE